MTCALGARVSLALAVQSGTGVTGDRHNIARAMPGASSTPEHARSDHRFASSAASRCCRHSGSRTRFGAVAAVGILAALGIWIAVARSHARRRVAAMAGAIAAAAAIVVFLPGDGIKGCWRAAPTACAPYIRLDDLETELRSWRLLYYADGAAATVAVREFAGMRSLAIDGKVDASNMGDMLTQRLLGLLPVLLHRDAQDICIIGLGSGVTVASALAPGTVRSADVVEISPEVVDGVVVLRARERRRRSARLAYGSSSATADRICC